MLEDRVQKLLDNKIYIWRHKKKDTFLTLCQKRVLDKRIENSGIDINLYLNMSETIEEALYRYANDDSEIKMCSQCKSKKVRFYTIQRGWTTFCSHHCSNKYKVENNICWVTTAGWKHSEETKKKMSENHADFTGDKNPFKNKIENDEEFRRIISNNKILYWRNLSEERRKEISEIFSKGQAESNKNEFSNIHKNHKSGHYYSKRMKKKMFYRSSWELILCEYLDKENNGIEYFDIEPFCIEYNLENGDKRFTRIDFHLIHEDGRQKIIEVKPKAFLTTGNVPSKIEGCKKYAKENNMEFIIITGEELEKLDEILQ